ncbi:hypothetical protein [Pseudohaliea rubra]|uniref:hypothetical protein n=1 Tax=Pseudohaliea rubra TaxID=475795 RepID=UPI001185DC8E|nr:hypothetical protein [Pseudohaliea rubra]
MNENIITGFFTLAGTIAGGLFAYLAARVGHRWDKAQRDIARLCDEVAAYYELEQLYKEEVAISSQDAKSAATIMREMRSRVAESGEFKRPSMTSYAAHKLRREWV